MNWFGKMRLERWHSQIERSMFGHCRGAQCKLERGRGPGVKGEAANQVGVGGGGRAEGGQETESMQPR